MRDYHSIKSRQESGRDYEFVGTAAKGELTFNLKRIPFFSAAVDFDRKGRSLALAKGASILNSPAFPRNQQALLFLSIQN